MAMPSVSGTLGGSSGVWAQLQQQQAERAADQAEQKARVLQARAQDARADADQAVEKARSIGVQSEQANGDAQAARRGLVAIDSLSKVRSGFDDLRQQIGDILQPETAAPTPPTGTAEQKVGSRIDVTA